MSDFLKIQDVCIDFMLDKGKLRAANKVTLSINKGEIIGLVGESGSGKSTVASALLNIVSMPGKITEGQIMYGENNILEYSLEDLNKYRWSEVAMIFQAAQNSMNPIQTVEEHFLETVWAHDEEQPKERIIAKASELLEFVRLDPQRVLKCYPHQLSGGMKQRTVIAMSLILDPKVLILDEPTTALDVITQAYIFDILKDIHEKLGVTMIFLTHDVAVIGSMADRIGVMYAGQIVELGSVYDIFDNPQHPYTQGLIDAAPSLTDDITKRRAIRGTPPNLIDPPPGCKFHPRCECVQERCNQCEVQLIEVCKGHFVRCLARNKEGGK